MEATPFCTSRLEGRLAVMPLPHSAPTRRALSASAIHARFERAMPARFAHPLDIVRLLAALALLCVLALPAPFFPAMAQSGAVAPERIAATAVAVRADGVGTEILIDLTAPVEVTAGVLLHPARMTLDLPGVVFGNGAGSGGQGQGLVAGYRYGVFMKGSSRIVLDLTAPSRLDAVSTEPGPAGTRLIVRLAKVSASDFESAARAAETQRTLSHGLGEPDGAPQQDVPGAGGADSLPLVVVDPGHGGIDPGAAHGGEIEKDIVLRFGLALRDKLVASGKVRVAMTRDDDTFLPLTDRVKFSRERGARFFISIHADTLGDGAGVRGATVYTSAARASDARTAQLAEKENRADLVAGIEAPEEQNDVADILFDLTRRETRQMSNQFAQVLVKTLRRTIATNKNPMRSANFWVLRAYDVPSVLLELGYLSNREDLALMLSEQWQMSTAEAVANAIIRYFGEEAARGPLRRSRAEEGAPL
jgi:N-acetylmuramoyl-L-alanine amidase